MDIKPLTLTELNTHIQRTLLSDPGLQQVWVTAETSGMRLSGGHCYLELVDKDDRGTQTAKIRATIWASAYYRLSSRFLHETGRQLGSDIKVMVQASVNFHPVFGISLNITDIDASYTMGDVMRRRNEILRRLTDEGIIDMNRELPWPTVPQRIAVISARGAAGYGDFINQLYNNQSRLRFTTRLFEATMQGRTCAASVIDALDTIAADDADWQCVVIIRGGGAETDLLAFDDYDLAANIAQFPVPVIIGIGHERDITVLDYVAKMRVKTPTAAAAWLISRGEQMLGRLQATAAAILQAVTEKVSGCHRQLAYIAGALPSAAQNALMRADRRLNNALIVLSGAADRRIPPEIARIDAYGQSLRRAVDVALQRARADLDAKATLIGVLSPEATLKRGYSITTYNGHAMHSPDDAPPGAVITTRLADGAITSIKQ